jgi:very-short-patch-repair endonuclease
MNVDKIPRQVFKNSNKKYWFTCEDCGYNFNSTLLNITTGKNWCPTHKNKTEKILLDYLSNRFDNVTFQAKYDWCRNPANNYQYSFDFVLEELKLIIELDGGQHFIQVSNWKSPKERQLVDVFKMNCALSKGYKIIRLLQEDVKFDRNSWKTTLLCHLKNPIHKVSYICSNNEYLVYPDYTSS